MRWDDVLQRLTDAGLSPVEEMYMEDYGKILAAQRPEFQDRNFRCTYGRFTARGKAIEVFAFPSEVHLREFADVIGESPWWLEHENVLFHFPECDPALVQECMGALS